MAHIKRFDEFNTTNETAENSAIRSELSNPAFRNAKVLYVSYFRYDNAEVQRINGIYTANNYKAEWEKNKFDFFSYGPDDVSATYLFKLTKNRFNQLLPLISDIEASKLDGEDCDDLLDKVTDAETVKSLYGGWVAEDENENPLSIGDKVTLVDYRGTKKQNEVFVITKLDGEEEVIYVEDKNKNEYYVSPQLTNIV